MTAWGHSRQKRLGSLATHVRCTSKSGHNAWGPSDAHHGRPRYLGIEVDDALAIAEEVEI